MAYVDETYYNAFAPSTPIADGEFAELAERASDVIDMLTFSRISMRGGLDALPAAMQAAVQKSTAAQIQYLQQHGGVAALLEDGELASASIGKFSYAIGASKVRRVNGVPVSPMVTVYLRNTGLLYAGVD